MNAEAKPGIRAVTVPETVPAYVQLTGTFTTVGTIVTGAGTAFLTEIRNTNIKNPALKYNYLYDSNQGVVREILSVNSDTSMTLREAFPANSAAVQVRCPDNEEVLYQEVRVTHIDGGKINNVSVPSTYTPTVFKNNTGFGVRPFALDGTGVTMYVETIQ